MRNEVLRMERVTYKEDEVVKLKDFNLQIFQGEVMGFLPVNSHGKTALLKLLERNLPLYDGYIYYGGEKVNTWKENYKAANRISIIQEKSSLAGNLNIADNIFVLRPGFRQWVIRTKILNRQMEPFFEDIGMDIPLNKDVEKLSTFERIILGTDCRKDLIRASIVFSEFLIKKYDAKSEQGQEKKGPQMCLAVTGHCLQHKRKQSTESSRYTSYHHCQKQPLKQVPHVTSDSSGVIA